MQHPHTLILTLNCYPLDPVSYTNQTRPTKSLEQKWEGDGKKKKIKIRDSNKKEEKRGKRPEKQNEHQHDKNS